jgi:hypothetical protein
MKYEGESSLGDFREGENLCSRLSFLKVEMVKVLTKDLPCKGVMLVARLMSMSYEVRRWGLAWEIFWEDLVFVFQDWVFEG